MLRLITAWSSDALAEWLADWYAEAPIDPFARELVVVPTPGMERFVTRRLARRLGVSHAQANDGVCAGVDFVQPGDLMARVLAAGITEDDPWVPGALQWHCLGAIDELVAGDDQRFVGLRHRLRPGTREARRVAIAREIAHLLDSYATQRPELLLQWAEGDTTQTPAQHLWQAEVFRHVLAHTGTEPWPLRVRQLLADGLGDAALPARLAVFGVTRYGSLETDFLRALARDRDVAVLMVEHSPGSGRRPPEDGNLLVATLGKEELFSLGMLKAMNPTCEQLPGYPAADHRLLRRLQASIAQDCAFQPEPAAAGDASLTVHGCAGPMRQVEVLRDQILQLLAQDPTLQARDVLVMCTDLDTYAPLIAQILGTTVAPLPGPTRDLRVSVADRVARIDNPVLQVVQTFTALLGTRMTTAEVLDLIELPAVADRFGLDARAHTRIEDLLDQAGIRWGVDAQHRETYGVSIGETHTWQLGLDRLAAGIAVDARNLGLVHGVAPVGSAGDDDVRLVAAVDAVVTVLSEAWQFARTSHPAQQWAEQLSRWVGALVADEWRLAAGMAVVTAALAGDNPISLGEVATLLDAELARYGPRPRVLAGGVDVVAMRPMRNIPFRVVCLLGMDDGAFPRAITLGGNDVLAVDPRPGERDPRAEDRQLFLDAVCAAEQHLVVTYSSRHPVSGHRLPPAAPLAELLDVVGDIVHHHPMAAHDPRNFATDPQGRVAASFDRPAAALASAAEPGPDPLREARIGPVVADVTLDELVSFWRSPAKAFLRHLGLPVDSDDDPADHELPIDMDGLARWKIGDELLRSGHDPVDVREVVAARGVLPAVGADVAWDEIAGKVDLIRSAAAILGAEGDEYARLALPLDPSAGTYLTGTLRHPATGPLVDISYSRSKPADILALRMRVAALSAAGIPVRGVLVRAQGRKVTQKPEQPWEQSAAALWLRTLAYLRQVGLTRPLPFASTTSAAYAAGLPDVAEATSDARRAWQGGFRTPGDRDNPEQRMLWDADWDTLAGVPPMPDTWLPRLDSLFAQVADFVFGRRP